MSDFMDRTLGIGLGTIGSSAVLEVILVDVILYTMRREPLKNLRDCSAIIGKKVCFQIRPPVIIRMQREGNNK